METLVLIFTTLFLFLGLTRVALHESQLKIILIYLIQGFVLNSRLVCLSILGRSSRYDITHIQEQNNG